MSADPDDTPEHAQARAELGRAIAAYMKVVEPDVYVSEWIVVTHKRSTAMEAAGQSSVGVTTPEQPWPLTRGLLDIALTQDRHEQAT